MLEKTIRIGNRKGIHVRPASLIARAVRQAGDRVAISANGRTVEEVSVLALLGLCLRCGDQVVLRVEGPGEAVTLETLASLFARSYDFS